MRPRTRPAFSERILWWEEVEAEAEDSAQGRGHNFAAVAGRCNGFCNLLVPYACVFSTELKKGLPLNYWVSQKKPL